MEAKGSDKSMDATTTIYRRTRDGWFLERERKRHEYLGKSLKMKREKIEAMLKRRREKKERDKTVFRYFVGRFHSRQASRSVEKNTDSLR